MLSMMHAASMESNKVLFKVSIAMKLSYPNVLGCPQIAQAEETLGPLACIHRPAKSAPRSSDTPRKCELGTDARLELVQERPWL
jgi:hypothetical protein